jgi:hypothetical protein
MQSFLQIENASHDIYLIALVFALPNALTRLFTIFYLPLLLIRLHPQFAYLRLALSKYIAQEYLGGLIGNDGCIIVPHRTRLEAHVRRLL